MKEEIAELLHQGASNPMRIHLIGVAGSGMSGIASLLIDLGHRVSGSDRVMTSETERLQRVGLDFHCPHCAETLSDAQLVIYSSAIKPGNVVYDAAVEMGLPMLRRAEALSLIMEGKQGIVIAGTHGKTTTAALAAHVLRAAGVGPSHYIGAEIPILGTNAHWESGGKYFVAEGDESDGSLVEFNPELSMVLNIEEEHLDHYSGGIEEIREVFRRFVEATAGGVVFCGSDIEASSLCRARKGAISYGWDEGFNFCAKIHNLRERSSDFEVLRDGRVIGNVTLGIPGEHNVLNALAVIALATTLGARFDDVVEAMRTFRGARRRFDVLYRSADYSVIDDYGHHPTEIKATIATARAANPERLVCVFQPHRYSRTNLMREQFGEAFQGVDALYVTDIYAASEEPIPGVSGELIVNAVRASSLEDVTYTPDVNTAHLAIGSCLRRGDMLLTLGAGNVHEVGARLARDLEFIDKLRRELDDPETTCRLYEPMRRHTTMKVGGAAQFWVEPSSVESFTRALSFFKTAGVPVMMMGRGSNLIIRDGGIAGAVIRLCKGEFDEISVSGETIVAGAGVRFKKVSNVAKNNGLGGFEWMEGIPGNVGGGLRMNAGAMSCQTFDQVVSVRYLDSGGGLHEKSGQEFSANYRNVPELIENFALSAVFRGNSSSEEEIKRRLDASMDKRRMSQPVAACAGCIFKNPASIPAGKLIEELGLVGTQVGAARVSDVHGNFIVNEGGAKAEDVIALIEMIQSSSREHRGIELQTEVKIIGSAEECF
ncbi:MAG: UDP-N-acetylmuramate--L-alanine ligase [Verrucomicrobiaceae bacterium]|nr:UDP-N-acetylmuramate--L-alanine ligase [Verrucomicrobiaceae bacterium]